MQSYVIWTTIGSVLDLDRVTNHKLPVLCTSRKLVVLGLFHYDLIKIGLDISGGF